MSLCLTEWVLGGVVEFATQIQRGEIFKICPVRKNEVLLQEPLMISILANNLLIYQQVLTEDGRPRKAPRGRMNLCP